MSKSDPGPDDLKAHLQGFLSTDPFSGGDFFNLEVPHVNRPYEARAFGLVNAEGTVLLVTIERGKITDIR
jgi:hypothetical protein